MYLLLIEYFKRNTFIYCICYEEIQYSDTFHIKSCDYMWHLIMTFSYYLQLRTEMKLYSKVIEYFSIQYSRSNMMRQNRVQNPVNTLSIETMHQSDWNVRKWIRLIILNSYDLFLNLIDMLCNMWNLFLVVANDCTLFVSWSIIILF